MSFPHTLRQYATLLVGLLLSLAVQAHEYTLGELHIKHPWARTTVPGQPAGGAYLNIENQGKHSDTLLGATSPYVKSIEIHTMSMDGDIMKMREVGSIEIKPAEKITMLPGIGYHLMLIGLSQRLKIGDKIPLTLKFEKGGKVDVMLFVEERDGSKTNAMEHMQH